MTDFIRDQNFIPVAGGVSSTSSTTPLPFKIDPVTGRLLMDTTSMGTVTSVSVVFANGFAGSVATSTTTPAITLSTTITGLLKGNGTAISAATAGTDYVTASSTNTFTNKTYDTAGTGNAFAINGTSITAVTGTGSVVLATTPTLVTPVLGVATGTSVTLSGAAAISSFSNTSDSASLQVLKLSGARATPAANDEIYQSFNLNSSTGVSREFARITGKGTTVTNTSENGSLDFYIQSSGTLTSSARLIVGAWMPTSNAGLTLGIATNNWGNVFLKNAAAIAWRNGTNTGADMTLTHATGSLTFAGGNVLGLGAATATTLNGNTFTTGTYTLTGTAAKTLNFTNTITLSGTDSTTMTFPTTSATIARTDAANTFTGASTATSWVFTTPLLGTPTSGVLTNCTGLPAASVVAGTFGTGSYTMDANLTVKQVINTSNAITATANAATVPITSRISTVTNSSAATLTITITTTSAVDGQMVMVRVLDFSAAAQTITWVNTENGSTVTTPTTSNGSTTSPLTVGFQYNSGTSKWRCIGKD